nr:Chain C, PROTEIN (MELANOMA-ASSOCIATED ANTIGEN 3) [Homo sapiens]
FLWGPRALV